MTQNTSHAVMAQRREPHDSLDDFPSPPWSVRALCVHVLPHVGLSVSAMSRRTVWEPAANRGHMARALGEFFGSVRASDVHDYGAGFPEIDFLWPATVINRPEWVITNPPFRAARDFAVRAAEVATEGFALLVRTQWTESVDRFNLFAALPPTLIAQFAERVPMVKGRLDGKASTATAYCWIVWKFGRNHHGTEWMHIPPCRKALERDGDYPEAGSVAA